MARKSGSAVQPVFHGPMRIDWTDDRLQTLNQEQLLSLLDNLDHQRTIGRIEVAAGATLDRRISALLTGRSGSKRRKQLADLAIAAVEEPR